ncbi:hypothetical protein MHYP_G00310540 [Metynnis hypsauchen]
MIQYFLSSYGRAIIPSQVQSLLNITRTNFHRSRKGVNTSQLICDRRVLDCTASSRQYNSKQEEARRFSKVSGELESLTWKK